VIAYVGFTKVVDVDGFPHEKMTLENINRVSSVALYEQTVSMGTNMIEQFIFFSNANSPATD